MVRIPLAIPNDLFTIQGIVQPKSYEQQKAPRSPA